MLHAYLCLGKFSYLHSLIRTYTLIDFGRKFLPTLLKHVGKIVFYLVPTRLLGPTGLLYFKKLSHLHRYLELTLIRDLRVYIRVHVCAYMTVPFVCPNIFSVQTVGIQVLYSNHHYSFFFHFFWWNLEFIGSFVVK